MQPETRKAADELLPKLNDEYFLDRLSYSEILLLNERLKERKKYLQLDIEACQNSLEISNELLLKFSSTTDF